MYCMYRAVDLLSRSRPGVALVPPRLGIRENYCDLKIFWTLDEESTTEDQLTCSKIVVSGNHKSFINKITPHHEDDEPAIKSELSS